MSQPPIPTPIFRLTHIDNIAVYLARGGMHAPKSTPNDDLIYKTIHNPEIQGVRRTRSIPCGCRGTIHDYVPFYFGARSPMLYQLCTGYVQDYNDGQDPLVYIISTVETIAATGISFVFSDGHGIAAYTDWFDNVEDLVKVDWEAVNSQYWRSTVEDPDLQRRKQAELLVHQFCPWSIVKEVAVFSAAVQSKVNSIMLQYSASTPVIVRRNLYY